jgi:hypothetical protein
MCSNSILLALKSRDGRTILCWHAIHTINLQHSLRVPETGRQPHTSISSALAPLFTLPITLARRLKCTVRLGSLPSNNVCIIAIVLSFILQMICLLPRRPLKACMASHRRTASRASLDSPRHVATSSGSAIRVPSRCNHYVVYHNLYVQHEQNSEWGVAVQYYQANLVLAKTSLADDLYADIDFRLGCAYEKTNEFKLAVEVCE